MIFVFEQGKFFYMWFYSLKIDKDHICCRIFPCYEQSECRHKVHVNNLGNPTFLTFCNLDKHFCEECLQDSDCVLDRLRCDKGLPFNQCVEKDFVENPHDFELAWKMWDDYVWEQMFAFPGNAARFLGLEPISKLWE